MRGLVSVRYLSIIVLALLFFVMLIGAQTSTIEYIRNQSIVVGDKVMIKDRKSVV